MFDSRGEALAQLSGVELAALIEVNHGELVERENRTLVLAAAWADLHDRDLSDRNGPLVERSRLAGGVGTPVVSEFTAAEFGTLQQVGMVSAWNLISAALDLRHRLPRLWGRVTAGEVRAWQARRVAEATRHLSQEGCGEVDEAISGYLSMVGWPRFQRILTAAVCEVDPALAAEREERARLARTVYAAQSEDGLRLMVARAAAGDVTLFMAMVNRIAEILKVEGDTDLVEVRRSKAIGVLAQPARALQLLMDHQHDASDLDEPTPDPEPNADTETEPEPDADAEPDPDPDADADADPDADADVATVASVGAGVAVGDAMDVGDAVNVGDACQVGSAVGGEGGVVDLQARPVPSPPVGDPDRAHTWVDLTPPARFDPVAARPRVVLHFHLSDTAIRTGRGMVRPDNGDDPISVNQLREWLVDTGCRVTVRPVFDPADVAPVDGYEIPQRTRAAVRLRNVADVFPYGTCTKAGMDLDHTQPYIPPDRAGPPGQTRPDNLGPLARSSHRAATHGRWQKRQPDPGTYLWR